MICFIEVGFMCPPMSVEDVKSRLSGAGFKNPARVPPSDEKYVWAVRFQVDDTIDMMQLYRSVGTAVVALDVPAETKFGWGFIGDITA